MTSDPCEPAATSTGKLPSTVHGWLTPEWIVDALDSTRGQLLDVHLQPIASATTGEVVACEALSRVTGDVPVPTGPEEVVEVAQRADLVDALTWSVLEHAMADVVRLRAAGVHVPVTINVPAQSVEGRELVGRVDAALERTGLPASALILEITETTPIVDLARARAGIAALDRRGVRVAIDDFGAGYSTPERLRALPVSIVKIDSAAMGGRHEPARRLVLQDLMLTARARGLLTIAEGIESAEDVDDVVALGIDWMQGFAVGPAMALDCFIAWYHGRAEEPPDATPVVAPASPPPPPTGP